MAATTIRLKPETCDLLRAIGGEGQTYDEIIQDIIAAYETWLEEIERRFGDPREKYIAHEELKKKWGIR